MSDYTKITDFAAKDSLATGTPAKAVKGAEIGADLDAIATAVATKADKSMTGVFLLADGTVSAPGLGFVSDTDTGLYLSGTHEISIAINGTQRVIVTSTGAVSINGPTDANNLVIGGQGGKITISRSSDGAADFVIGSDGVGSSNLAIANNGGSVSKLTLTGGGFTLTGNSQDRLVISATVATATQLYEPYNSINALKNIATRDSGSFTGTLTGCTTSPTASFTWSRNGSAVTLNCDAGLSATSNSTSMTVTGLPTALRPARTCRMTCIVTDAGLSGVGRAELAAGTSTITFGNLSSLNNISPSGFTASGTKGVTSGFTVTYSLD